MTPTRTALATAAALLLALTTACGSDSDDPEPEQTTAEEATTEPVEDPSTPDEPAPTENAGQTPAVLDFGQTHTYDDGLALTIDVVETWVPTDFGENEPYALLETTFFNNSDTALQIDALWQGCTVDGVTDPDGYELFQDVTTQWPNLVRGGGEAVWRSACEVSDGAELQVDLTVGDREPAWWAGPVPQP